MKERISRDGDEKIYQPRIHSDRIKQLHQIGVETGLPLTVLVDYSLNMFIRAYEKKKQERAAAAEMEKDFNETVEEASDERAEDLSTYLEPYQNSPYGETY